MSPWASAAPGSEVAVQSPDPLARRVGTLAGVALFCLVAAAVILVALLVLGHLGRMTAHAWGL